MQYMPMDSFRQAAETLNEESLENCAVSAERLEGTIRLTAPKFIVFPVARANGWSLTVDGEKRKAEGANLAYMGLLLEAGEHEIQLIYRTPGLKAGFSPEGVNRPFWSRVPTLPSRVQVKLSSLASIGSLLYIASA